MKKRKCPICDFHKINESKDYLSCPKCGWIHKKTQREKNE